MTEGDLKRVSYVYDVEIFPNFFGVTFIPEFTPQALIDTYIKIDKRLLRYKHKKEVNVDPKIVEELVADKKRLMTAMGVRQFYIYKGSAKNKGRNDLPLLMDFFINHKIITGYNSNNYDRTMLDLLIYNHRSISPDGHFAKEGKHITEFMFYHSSSCIAFGNGYYKLLGFKRYYKRPFTDYDIQKILYLDKTMTSLKQVAICLKWYRIQDLPLPYDQYIKADDIEFINDYNVNDVLITLTLKRSQQKEIDLREDISNEFGIDVRNLSRSSIGKAITTEFYEKFSGIPKKQFEDTKTTRHKIRVDKLISEKIKFETPILRNLLVKINNQTIVIDKDGKTEPFKHIIRFADTVYTMALGGLHSQDDARIFDYSTKWIYRDADVGSYYPNGILNFDVFPAHLVREAFRAVVGHTTDTRIHAKEEAGKIKNVLKKILKKIGEANETISKELVESLRADYDALHKMANKLTTKAEGLKIAINRMYGAFRDINDYLYDPKCTYKTTINLQLALLMLIERLEIKGIDVISANTDGIVCKFTAEQEADYKEACDWWQEYFNFTLEFTEYEKYFRNDVNNYIAIKKGFKDLYDKLPEKTTEKVEELEEAFIKRKGLFIQEVEFNKGYNSPVISKALNQFFIYGVPYDNFIENYIHTSPEAIYDYCISQRSNKKYSIVLVKVEDGQITNSIQQKSNRFYVCRKGGGAIVKRALGSKDNRLVKGYYVKIFNDFIEEDGDYDVNFAYYKAECSKIIYGKKVAKRKVPKGIVRIQTDFLSGLFEKQDAFEEVLNPEIPRIDFYKGDEDERRNKPLDFVPNNTAWGVMGFETESEYKAAMKQMEDDQHYQDVVEGAPYIDWDNDDLPF